MVDERSEPGRGVSRSRWGPVAGGALLDVVDLLTYGAMGLYGGFLIGGLVGWWVASQLGLGRRGRLLLALAAAVYSATPATETVPLGTILGLLIGIRGR